MPRSATSDDVAEVIPGLAKLAEGIGRSGGAPSWHDRRFDSPITTRLPTIPPPVSDSGATIITNKRKDMPQEDFFNRHVRHCAGGRARSSHKVSFLNPRQGGLMPSSAPPPRAMRWPASSLLEARLGYSRRRDRGGLRRRCSAGARPRRRWPSALRPNPSTGMSASASDMNTDIHADAEYRAHLVGVMGAPRGCGCDRALSASNDLNPGSGARPVRGVVSCRWNEARVRYSRQHRRYPEASARNAGYVSDRPLATVLFLAAAPSTAPLYSGGRGPGVGKTEIAKVLSQALGRSLIRLQVL